MTGSYRKPSMYIRSLIRSYALSGLTSVWLAAVSVSAGPTIQYDSGDPTGTEQYMLELINRARMGPAQEGMFLTTQSESDIVSAYAFFNVSKPGVVSQFSVIPQAQPLAMNKILLGTARAQSLDQQTYNYQGHTSHDGRAFNVRINQAGYVNAALAENVYAPIGAPISSILYGHVGLNIDWGVPDLGHRKAIMGLNDPSVFDYGTLREVGVGLVQNPNSGAEPNSWFITQDFGVVYDMSSGSFGPTITPFLVGVVYTDLDSDGFYSPGEGAGGITVMPDVGTYYAVTASAGGYAFPLTNLPPGTTVINLTFSGGPLGTRQITRQVALNGPKNIKADVVLVADPATRLGNISTRLRFETGANVGIAGFIVSGSSPKRVLIRGVGPSLAQFGIAGTMSNPMLQVFDSSGSGVPIASNDDWQNQADGGAAVLATGQQPSDSRESAVVLTLQPGQYTAIVSGVGGEMGVGRVDVIDLDPAASNSRAINVSTRGHVLTDPAAMIGGFVINGTHTRRVVIRAIGPSLAQFGVPGALAATTFQVFDSSNSGVPIASNTGWQNGNRVIGIPPSGGSMAELQTHGLAPSSANESAIVLTLAPGAYTVVVRGVNNTTGVGLVEVYDLEE